MSDEYTQGHGDAGKHQAARQIAERAMAAEAAGDQEEADRLFAEASRIDPEAVSAALQEGVTTAGGAGPAPSDDEEIAAMTRTVEPGADAPSRAGISDSGSGADGMGHAPRFPAG